MGDAPARVKMNAGTFTGGRAWFPRARFGIFVHFGLYTLLGGNENQCRNGERTPEEYAADLMPRFNPVRFDADEWVRQFQEAGARYLVLTTKHFEGFCLWDTALTEFKITNTPFGRDLIREIADACHRHGLRLGLYYATDNWHYRESEVGIQEARTYPGYVRAQVREILSRYGTVDEIWFDGSDKRLSIDFVRGLVAEIHEMQPTTVVNDRGINHSHHRNLLLGDFVTPERQIPDYVADEHPFLECCDAMGTRGWGYHAQQRFWSSAELIRRLSRVASLGGNYLLNVEPQSDGRIRVECLERLHSIGSWLEQHGEAIYGTEECPVSVRDAGTMDGPIIGGATRRENALFLHLHDWPKGDTLLVPHLQNLPESISFLSDDTGSLAAEADKGGILISGLPAAAPDNLVSVLRLQFSDEPKFDRDAIRRERCRTVVVRPGETVSLTPEAALRTGEGGVPWHVINRFANGNTSIGHLVRLDCDVQWQIEVPAAGRYHAYADLGTASMQKDCVFTLQVANQTLKGMTVENGWYDTPTPLPLGEVFLSGGLQVLTLRVIEMPQCFSDIHRIVLQPVG
jgi:alpha-L-fucosidase